MLCFGVVGLELVDQCCALMLSGLHVSLFWLVFEVSVECGAWPACGYNWSHLKSNIVVWSFGLHISSLCPSWAPSSRCLVSQNEHYFMFYSLFGFQTCDFCVWRPSYLLPFVSESLRDILGPSLVGFMTLILCYCSDCFCLIIQYEVNHHLG